MTMWEPGTRLGFSLRPTCWLQRFRERRSDHSPRARATHTPEAADTESLPWVSAYISRMVCVDKSRRGFPLSPPVSERRAPWRLAGRLTVVFVTIKPSMPNCGGRQRELSSQGTVRLGEAAPGAETAGSQVPTPTAPESRTTPDLTLLMNKCVNEPQHDDSCCHIVPTYRAPLGQGYDPNSPRSGPGESRTAPSDNPMDFCLSSVVSHL